ncbi:MAG: TRAP transporter small permease [Deltaproteobacteria bacterium]|nr:TRAP transporter small permease [Deltaproteobacteria bacterium]
MKKRVLIRLSDRISHWMEIFAGVVLVLILVITGCDIVGRIFDRPIPGTYEMVSFAGGLVIGLALPVTSRERAHVIVDIVISRVSSRAGTILHVMTRLMVIALFLLLGYATFRMGIDFRIHMQMTPVLGFPYYPVAYIISGACYIESLVLVADCMKEGDVRHE